MIKRKWLYLPVEIKVRELHSKVLLACEAAAKGYTVVIGRKSEISAISQKLPSGIYLGFGAHKNFAKQYARLKDLGHNVHILDEEGLVTFSKEVFHRTRLSHEAISLIKKAYTWGEFQKSMIEDFLPSQVSIDIQATGNPRFDILSNKFRNILLAETSSKREKYGKYILVVSSFGSCNHFLGRDKYFSSLKEKNIIQSDDDEKFFKGYFSLKERNLEGFIDTLPALADKYSDYNFIIRPHPSENPALWHEAAKSHSNIHVESDGDIQVWLLGASAAVHHFCTTALEAFMADVPSIALRVEKSDIYESNLPYNCSYEANSYEDMCVALDDILQNNAQLLSEKRSHFASYYRDYIANFICGSAHENIVKNFDKEPLFSRRGYLLYALILRLKIKSLMSQLRPKINNEYSDHKFNKLDLSEIVSLIDEFAKIKSDYCKVKASKIGDYSFIVQSLERK